MPKKYIKVTYAVGDYTTKVKGGLRLKKGQKVYVVLITANGWCVGMAGGQWGVFQQSAVSTNSPSKGELQKH